MSKTLKMIVHELPRTLGEINHKLLLADLKLALKEVEKLEQQLQQAHREGWEQAKREAARIAKQTDFPPSPKSYYTLGREDAAKAIAAMEYKEPTNER